LFFVRRLGGFASVLFLSDCHNDSQRNKSDNSLELLMEIKGKRKMQSFYKGNEIPKFTCMFCSMKFMVGESRKD
jgi:hypothetical protein